MKTSDLEDPVAFAFRFASAAHHGQTVKGTTIPYISHPMAVAAIIWEFGGTTEQVIAGLLHDVVEDTERTLTDIEKTFGHTVAKIVADCTDSTSDPKPPWRARKEAYLKHIQHESDPSSVLVSLADKFHNVNRILNDLTFLESNHEKLWSLFSAPPDQIVWYYNGLLGAFMNRMAEFTPAEKASWPKLGTLIRKFQLAVYHLEAKVSVSFPEDYRVYHVDGFDGDSDDILWRTFKTRDEAAQFATAYAKMKSWSLYFGRIEEILSPTFDRSRMTLWGDYLVVRYKDGSLLFSTDDLKTELQTLPNMKEYEILKRSGREEDLQDVEELKGFITAIQRGL